MSYWLWLVAGCALGLWWAINRESSGRRGGGHGHGGHGGGDGGGKFKRWINFAIFFIGVIAALHMPIPWTDSYPAALCASLIAEVASWFGIAVPVGAIAEVVVIILLIALIVDLWGRKVDKVARTAIIVAPILCVLSTGPVGGGLENAFHRINGGTTAVVQDIGTNQAHR